MAPGFLPWLRRCRLISTVNTALICPVIRAERDVGATHREDQAVAEGAGDVAGSDHSHSAMARGGGEDAGEAGDGCVRESCDWADQYERAEEAGGEGPGDVARGACGGAGDAEREAGAGGGAGFGGRGVPGAVVGAAGNRGGGRRGDEGAGRGGSAHARARDGERGDRAGRFDGGGSDRGTDARVRGGGGGVVSDGTVAVPDGRGFDPRGVADAGGSAAHAFHGHGGGGNGVRTGVFPLARAARGAGAHERHAEVLPEARGAVDGDVQRDHAPAIRGCGLVGGS